MGLLPEHQLEALSPLSTGRRRWVPIRSLAPRHRERIGRHLLDLSPQDRYLRFGYNASDGQIRDYVACLDFERDEVFGIFNRRLLLISLAHLAYGPMPIPLENWAEFGVSVLAKARGRGYGARLFAHAMLRASNRGCGRLFIQALNENAAMIRIAVRAGASLQRSGPEAEAWLELPRHSHSSRVDELVEEQAAQWNYRFKVHAHRWSRWVQRVKAVRHAAGEQKPEDTDA